MVDEAESVLDSLPKITARQAYLAMFEFLREECELAGQDHKVDLRALLAEMEPEVSGSTADPGGVLSFADAIRKVLSSEYASPWLYA